MSLIEFKNVDFSYFVDNDDGTREEVKVLKNFNLDIEEGSFVAILGHNGSGKSTIAKLTNGILFPTNDGEIYVNGLRVLDDDSVFDVRCYVGMVFQNPDNQIVSSIVEEDVAFGVENLGIPCDECRTRVDEALKTVDMYDFRLKAPDKLSGGQKQRVAVAGIIAMKPKCIILDESTSMLDPKGRREVMDTIIKLNREENITIMHITHNMDEAVLADRVVVINNGNIELDGTPSEVFKNVDKLKALGLDVPQSTQLIKELSINTGKTILNAQACAEELYKILEG